MRAREFILSMRWLIVVVVALLPLQLLFGVVSVYASASDVAAVADVDLDLDVVADLDESVDPTIDKIVILERLTTYVEDLSALSQQLSMANSLELLQRINKEIKRIDLKWEGYYNTNRQVVSEDDFLIGVVVEWQSLMEQMSQTMTYKQGLCGAEVELERVRSVMIKQDGLYDEMVEDAIALSLSKRLAKELDKLKSDEQVAFEEVNSGYSAIKQLSEQYDEIKLRVDTLDRLYVDVKRRSEVIQAQEFKPLFVRVKDYLMGIAAVAMILMFLNMAQAKYKQLKGESAQLKKMKKMMEGDNKYPTI